MSFLHHEVSWGQRHTVLLQGAIHQDHRIEGWQE
jgi:hypothetical protein